jgi:hypothetical protein
MEVRMMKVMTRTGETAEQLGLYSSECCNVELIFDSGDTFTRCPRCLGLCVWDFDSEVVSCEELEGARRTAA